MNRLRIAAAYVFGTGSSLVLKNRIEHILKQHGIAADVFVTDLNLRPEDAYDVIFTSKELTSVFLPKGKPIVIINNFLSQQEIESKGIPVILSLTSKPNS